MYFEPETIDLARLADDLNAAFGGAPPLGYLPGRTAMRDAVVSLLGCSLLQAEEVVDTMIAQRLLVYEGPTSDSVDDLRAWRIAKGSSAD